MPAEQSVKIAVRGLTKVFGDSSDEALALLRQGASKQQILDKTGQAVGVADANFDVYEGEILVIMGLSGSGKSSLIRCLNRLNEPTSGEILIDGEDIVGLGHRDLLRLRRQKFGMVFQHFALFPHRSIRDNVEYGLEIQGIAAEERAERATIALKQVGLEGWEDAMPGQLSGGMQQRVGLARALAVDPDVLLMDEAFSALDPLIRRDMQQELVALQSRMRKTIVFITHDLDEALFLGNRIILMKDARIEQVGTAEEILSAPATPYVERFVAEVDKSKVLTASSVMRRPRSVAFVSDGPRTVLRKMEDEDLNLLCVVEPDFRLRGVIRDEVALAAAQRGDKSIKDIIEPGVTPVSPETPVRDLFAPLSQTSLPAPVVDASGILKGIVIRASLLQGLAEQTIVSDEIQEEAA
ncbi:glycine betaine/L-proline ABC transporter ATP-binding protein [Thiorhodococcus mannitoliphagus]|uniref:Quaternary amine transport ATP-binding protein n=1 Tax=Thiorhodococcus mannitoliphagus TaxID=329406 RepID=A0A6P1DPC1_9GAMM|nr:glycine betaine/L-proline ABC transporter ATP-binding protein [Thiorhodococcus mannitoliphagus]NEX18751.1 glycine betaine/L-proline ABC transporter ATP-binding protein [Thiorhodococcus mannitoliphagus]